MKPCGLRRGGGAVGERRGVHGGWFCEGGWEKDAWINQHIGARKNNNEARTSRGRQRLQNMSWPFVSKSSRVVKARPPPLRARASQWHDDGTLTKPRNSLREEQKARAGLKKTSSAPQPPVHNARVRGEPQLAPWILFATRCPPPRINRAARSANSRITKRNS